MSSLACCFLTAIVARWMVYYHFFFRIFCFFYRLYISWQIFCLFQVFLFFIHAPTRGATLWRKNRHGKNTNPRSHTGSDIFLERDKALWIISIHAPHTGSDESSLFDFNNTICGQSTLPHGGAATVLWVSTSRFSTTLPHGELTGSAMSINGNDFNPRSHTRGATFQRTQTAHS